MPVDVAELLGGAVSGAVVSAILGPLIAQRHERRDLRANVLRAISEVERTRWAPNSWEDFREAVYALRAAALVAGANREIVDYYIFLAQVAERASTDDFEPADGEYAGGISSALATLVRDAAEAVVDQLWHSVRGRRATRAAITELRRREQELHEDDPALPWSVPRL